MRSGICCLSISPDGGPPCRVCLWVIQDPSATAARHQCYACLQGPKLQAPCCARIDGKAQCTAQCSHGQQWQAVGKCGVGGGRQQGGGGVIPLWPPAHSLWSGHGLLQASACLRSLRCPVAHAHVLPVLPTASPGAVGIYLFTAQGPITAGGAARGEPALQQLKGKPAPVPAGMLALATAAAQASLYDLNDDTRCNGM